MLNNESWSSIGGSTFSWKRTSDALLLRKEFTVVSKVLIVWAVACLIFIIFAEIPEAPIPIFFLLVIIPIGLWQAQPIEYQFDATGVFKKSFMSRSKLARETIEDVSVRTTQSDANWPAPLDSLVISLVDGSNITIIGRSAMISDGELAIVKQNIVSVLGLQSPIKIS